jgi:hypothetical protein
MSLDIYPASSLQPAPSTTLVKSITMEYHQIRTEPQSQPTENSKGVEVAKEELYAQPLQRVKGTKSTSIKSSEG